MRTFYVYVSDVLMDTVLGGYLPSKEALGAVNI